MRYAAISTVSITRGNDPLGIAPYPIKYATVILYGAYIGEGYS
jgi:hypothetical protein